MNRMQMGVLGGTIAAFSAYHFLMNTGVNRKFGPRERHTAPCCGRPDTCLCELNKTFVHDLMDAVRNMPGG